MKKNFLRNKDVNTIASNLRTIYINKYYNLFIKSMKWNGLTSEQEDYVMRRFWTDGTVAGFRIKNLDELAFTPYFAQTYNIYDFPSTIQLINKWNVPFIPMNTQVVGKDVIIGWCQANHKPVRLIVENYIDRIVNVEMVINTNLQLQKMPFMVGVSPADVKKAEDIVDRILNNEVAVFADLEDLNLVKAFALNNNYIIDKLYSYKTSLENELLTYLGLDNAMIDDTKDRLILDQVNANNQEINANQEGMLDCLKDFAKELTDLTGISVSVEPRHKPAESIHEEPKRGDKNDKSDK